MLIYDWLKSISKDVTVRLDYVVESHVEWIGEHEGRLFNVTSTFLYGPNYTFRAEETIGDLCLTASSVYVSVTELSSGRRWQGELVGHSDEVSVDYTNVSFMTKRTV